MTPRILGYSLVSVLRICSYINEHFFRYLAEHLLLVPYPRGGGILGGSKFRFGITSQQEL